MENHELIKHKNKYAELHHNHF